MKTIFYELNEVPKRLFEFYSENSPNSSFAKLRERGNLFETISQDVGHLSPWITWPSLHRGVSNIQHKISELGQNLEKVDLEYPPLWHFLTRYGVSVGMFGSLQSYPLPNNLDNYKFYVPDTFAAGPECFPDALTEFQRLNLSMVKTNGRNVTRKIAMRDAIKFLVAAPQLGIRGKTLKGLATQLVSECANKNRVVRRRTNQVQIAFDFFLKQLKNTKPHASFFFTNHVASSMHRYWPCVFPEDYEEGKFDRQWLLEWRQEIPFTVDVANSQLAELMTFVEHNNDYRLVVLSSMGQAAVQDVEPVSKHILITDVEKLLSFIGMSKNDWEPRLSMAPRVVIKLKNSDAKAKLEKLNSISINNTHISRDYLHTGDVRLLLGIKNAQSLEIRGQDGQEINPNDLGVTNIDVQDASSSYAYHIPEGILIEYKAGGASSAEYGNMDKNIGKNIDKNIDKEWRQISALDVAPSVLKNFGIEKPSYMQGDGGLFGQ